MNSIAKALNNIAAALQSISNEMKKNKADVVVSKTTTSNPYAGSVNITSTYVSKDSEGWFSLNASEKEQLYYIYKAIVEKGVNKKDIYATDELHFNKLMDHLNKDWPSLHRPIEKIILLNKKSLFDKLNKKYNSPKQLWHFPHNHDLS